MGVIKRLKPECLTLSPSRPLSVMGIIIEPFSFYSKIFKYRDMLWKFRAAVDWTEERKSTFESKFDCRSEDQSHDSLPRSSIELLKMIASIERFVKAFVNLWIIFLPYFL